MVTANDDQDTSESVEVFFAGTTFRPINDGCTSPSTAATTAAAAAATSAAVAAAPPLDYNEAGYDNALYELANRKYEYAKPVKKHITVTDM